MSLKENSNNDAIVANFGDSARTPMISKRNLTLPTIATPSLLAVPSESEVRNFQQVHLWRPRVGTCGFLQAISRPKKRKIPLAKRPLTVVTNSARRAKMRFSELFNKPAFS